MTVDTRVDGNPGSVRFAASWLRDALAPNIDATVDTMYSIRNSMDSAWDGPASQLACTTLTDGALRTIDFGSAAKTFATAIDDFAAGLQTVHEQMDRVRSDAVTAGLMLTGDSIVDPGSQSQALRLAYEAAQADADAARQIETSAGKALKDTWLGVTADWFFLAADLVGGASEGAAALRVWMMAKSAERLAEDAARSLELAKSAPPGTPAAQIYRDVDASRTAVHKSVAAKDAAEKFETKAGRFLKGFGGAMAVGAIVYDIYEGKPVDQAVVSGGLGFGAAVAAGAMIGSVIPIPIAGTLLGAAGGAVVGIFTSGAVDTLYTEGLGSTGEAIGDGVAAVVETGTAIGELATGAWDAIF